jgi:SOS-response transcriptional repressor LexA
LRNTHIIPAGKFAQHALRGSQNAVKIKGMTVGKNIRRLRKQQGLTLNQLATEIGSDVGNLSRIERGVQGYSDQIINKIAGALRVPVAELFIDPDIAHIKPKNPSDGKWKNYFSSLFDENVASAMIGMRPVPVISAVQAGQLKDMENPYSPGDGYSIEYTDQKLSRWAFALEVEGQSMTPTFQPGDRIIVDPEIAPQPGDYVIARNGSDQATFKKYRPRGVDDRGNMVFELVPLNDDYPTMRSDTEHLIVIGVVTEHRKKLRRV